MSQPIDAGAMLGGRYQVTELVLTSADGDQVLSGIDQVLNRPVSILVGSTANASQLATSAREIATGERYAAVQVLDLGISEGSTYLVTNLADPADLLDLVVRADAPFVEPFYTDTLGTEIFGVTRSTEPASYEDDAEYYEDQRAQEEQRPAMLDRLPEISLNEKLNSFKGRFARGKQSPPSVPPVPPAATVGSNTEQSAAVSAHSSPSAPAPVAPSPAKAPVPVATPATPAATQATPTAPPAPKAAPAARPASKVTRMEPTDHTEEPAVTSAAALAAAQKSRGVSVDDSGQRVASSFPAAAHSYSEPAREEYEDEEAGEGGKKTRRLLVGALLCAVLVFAVVLAYNALGGRTPAPVASGSPTQSATESGSEGEQASKEPTAAPVKPEVADLARMVPGNQDLNADTDSTLSKAIDGNPASLYRSFSYTSPQFGGLASNMVFIAELEKLSDVSEIQLEGLNGTGGSFELRVGKTDDLSDAKVVSTGSFTGPTVTVPVSGEDGAAAKGQYVFLDVTELPRRASGANPSRPYGLQIGEFRVS